MQDCLEDLRRALHLLREPVEKEKQRILAARWSGLDLRWRAPGQGYGQKATGCGATIGVHPRCDFDCAGCYLGAEANHVRPLGLDAIRGQLEALRAYLGPKGNVQVTDGEVTLLPAETLIEILRYARSIGLIPMVMTHGDSFRRRPGLLPRLMTEGLLTEVAIHIDSTQRGRVGFGKATSESDLDLLRDEFARMIREARRTTLRSLRAALTMTITRENLASVPALVDWCFRNRDAFSLVSFQPLAHVGRTQPDLEGVGPAALWERIGAALTGLGLDQRAPGSLRFGHPDCSRVESMLVCQAGGAPPLLFPIVRPGDPEDERVMSAFLRLGLGGINFRDDRPLERICRLVGAFRADPRFFLRTALPWIGRRLEQRGLGRARFAAGLALGRIRLDAFTIVSHHFMSKAELETPVGRERLAACAFRVPIDGEMVSMCRVNAGRLREELYARSGPLARDGPSTRSMRQP